jgi:Putative DNA-binding domain
MNAAQREAQRQQTLLRVLLGDTPATALAGWLRGATADGRGLAAYRANAAAVAERALAAAYPTLQQLVGDASFAALARDFWRHHPPAAGDLGDWGAELAGFVADASSLADEPCLPDVARLEWAVHQAGRAADAAAPQGLELLASHDPAQLWIQLAPGTAVLVCAHPVAAIWQAHRSDAPDRFAPVKAAYAAGGRSCTLVARAAWRVAVTAIEPPEARYTQAVLAGQPLALALDAAGNAFDFEAWLLATLRRGVLAAVQTSCGRTTPV